VILRAILLALLIAAPAQAQLRESQWLPRGSSIAGDLLERPREALEGGAQQTFYVELGRLAFRSFDILGGNARRAGLSCNACHPNGHANARFFIPGLSDQPGRIDVTNALWNHRNEDGVFNPLPIPSLRGVGSKMRFGHAQHGNSLRDLVGTVLVVEFAGDEPSPIMLDALVAYLRKLPVLSDAAMEPVTLDGDIADLRRYLRVLNTALLDEDAALAEQVVRMVRGQIGFVAERFDVNEHRRAFAVLDSWDVALREIDGLAVKGDFPRARRALASLTARMTETPPDLRAALPSSLYDPDTVRRKLR
jgi:hypothetical protein